MLLLWNRTMSNPRIFSPGNVGLWAGICLAAAATATETQPANPDRAIQDEVIYFVLPDRFANGDPGNDLGGYPDQPELSGFDPTHKG